MFDRKQAAVESAVRSGDRLKWHALKRAHTTASRALGFTLAEVLVSVGVLVLLVFLASRLLNTAATFTTLGHKQMDADAQTRQLLDRLEVDVAQMVKRADVDYYVKSSWLATGSPSPAPGCSSYCSSLYSSGVRAVVQPGNDILAFYGYVPGYYPSTSSQTSQSPLSLVAYRVFYPSPPPSPCGDCNKLQRMGKGLVWNAVNNNDVPVVFLPIPMASAVPTPELPQPTVSPNPTPAWPEINPANNLPWLDSQSEIIGPQVFRFEYYYLLKGQTDPINGAAYDPLYTDTPWDARICSCPTPTPTPIPSPTPTITPAPTPAPLVATPTPPVRCCHAAPEGMQDVAAIVVVIAVIDPGSRGLVTDAQLARLNGADGQPPALIDWGNTTCVGCPNQQDWQKTPGLLLAQWQAAITANTIGLPRPAVSGIRVYERVLYLPPPTLLAP